jgi:pimeloyl-ACP methyl ester carboxylesterase
VSALISLGGRPCLPDGTQVEGAGAWQRFFVAAARKAPKVTEFAASAVMAMSRRIGPNAMLKSLWKDSAADMALLRVPEVAVVLEANIALMSDKSSASARAFANEYIAFQSNWSQSVPRNTRVPTRIIIADEDPTFDLAQLPRLAAAYPEMQFEVQKNACLALLYQHFQHLIPRMALAAQGGG